MRCAPAERTLTAGAGALWRDVVRAAFAAGLTPPVLPDHLGGSVGGLLSTGGFGGSSHRYGPVADWVRELEVVTGTGERLVCAPDRRPELFRAVLAGLGQCALIVRATLALVPAPTHVRRYRLYHDAPGTYLTDQRRLARDSRFSHVAGQARPALGGRWRWRYMIEAEVPHDGGPPADDELSIGGLDHHRDTEEIADLSFAEYVHRLDRDERLLRATGEWDRPHPWLTLLLPEETAGSFVPDVLAEGAQQGLRFCGTVRLRPLTGRTLHAPLLRRPAGELLCLLALMRTAPPAAPDVVRRLVAANRALYERARAVGGVLHPIGALPMSPGDWRAHFGPVWPDLVRAKDLHDPHYILTGGVRPVDMTAVTVLCGASPGHSPGHLRTAAELGRALAGSGLRLVYGGARTGLMGAVADGAPAAGGAVTGVVPRLMLPYEITHTGWARRRSCWKCCPGRSCRSTANRVSSSTRPVSTALCCPSWNTRGTRASCIPGTWSGSSCVRRSRRWWLHAASSVFADVLDEVCALLDPYVEVPLRDVMFAEAGTPTAALLDRIAFGYPAVFALQIAQYRLLESQGVRPDVLFGYSAGHMAAAHTAGVLSLPDACRAVGTPARLAGALPKTGFMAAVEASPGELNPGPGAVIAAVNGPRSVVVSGDRAAVRRICAEWAARGRRTHPLRLDVAPHSPHFDALLDDYRRALESLDLRASRLPAAPRRRDGLRRARAR